MKALSRIAAFLSDIFLMAAVICAIPFGAMGLLLDKLADDLAGEWRRGRDQNWLWRLARKREEANR